MVKRQWDNLIQFFSNSPQPWVNIQLLDEVEQNIVICAVDLRDTYKSRYFAMTKFNAKITKLSTSPQEI